MVTITEAAALLKVSRPVVYRLIAEGALTPQQRNAVLKGGPRLIPREQVEALKAQKPDAPAD